MPDSHLAHSCTVPTRRLLASTLPRLLSELASWERPAVLILDDVHRIVDTTALDVLASLTDHAPHGFRIVLTGRAAPDLPYARFRAQREMLEIGPDLLALDEAEVGALVEALGHRCSREEIRDLTERTEGWAAAVYLASLAHERHAGAEAVEIRASGRDRFITEYIRSELMDGLAREDVELLTRTSVLEAMTAPLAEAVCGLPERGAQTHVPGPQEPAHPERWRDCRDVPLPPSASRLPEGGAGPPGAGHRGCAARSRGGVVCGSGRCQPGRGSRDRERRHRRSRQVDHGRVPGHVLWRPLGHRRPLGPAASTRRRGRRHPPLAVIAGWMHLLSGRAEEADRMADIVERSTFERAAR